MPNSASLRRASCSSYGARLESGVRSIEPVEEGQIVRVEDEDAHQSWVGRTVASTRASLVALGRAVARITAHLCSGTTLPVTSFEAKVEPIPNGSNLVTSKATSPNHSSSVSAPGIVAVSSTP